MAKPQEPQESKSWADEVEEEQVKEVEAKMKTLTPNEDSKKVAADRGGLHPKDREAKVVVEQEDPNSPLYSAHTFEELKLSPNLLKGIYDMGFNKPSKIQEAALPVLLGNPPKNMIAQAQSGTGKTAAFTLTMLSRCAPERKVPQALCICPTRELAAQIYEVAGVMGKYCGLEMQLIVKEATLPKEIRAQLLVGTPGKVSDLIKSKALPLKDLKILVLDEADVMVDTQGLGDQSLFIKTKCPPTTQILLFSATYKNQVRALAEKFVPRPSVSIQLKREELTLDGIQQLFIDCKSEDKKYEVLSDIYGYLTIGQSIIFVSQRKTAQELSNRMLKDGHTVGLIFGGDMSAAQRDQIIKEFRDGKIKVLITTNLLARGIDVLQVMLVINYDLPLDGNDKPDPETYLHRIGRSGRFGRKGIAINFVHDPASKNCLKFIQDTFKRPIVEFPQEKLEDLQGMLQKVQKENEESRRLQQEAEKETQKK